MKNFILSLAILVTSFATQAHTISPVLCGTGGKVKISGTLFDYDGTAHPSYVLLYITTNGNSNGTKKWQGKAYIQSNQKFSMDTVPFFSYSTSDRKVFWVQYEWSHGSYQASDYDGTITLSTSCAVMPVTLTVWTAKISDKDKDIVNMFWSVDMESNVAYYRIDASSDNGKTWDSLTSIKSKVGGNTSLKTDYTYDYYNPLVSVKTNNTAKNDSKGLGAMGVALAIGVIAVSLRSRGMIGVACLMIVATISCKKSVDAPAQTHKYNAFRLSNVDIDGQSKTFETRTVRY
jgi:hypothetical protein